MRKIEKKFSSDQERMFYEDSANEQKRIEEHRLKNAVAIDRFIRCGLAGIFFISLGILPYFSEWSYHLRGYTAMIAGLGLAVPIVFGLFLLDTAVGKPFRNYLFPD